MAEHPLCLAQSAFEKHASSPLSGDGKLCLSVPAFFFFCPSPVLMDSGLLKALWEELCEGHTWEAEAADSGGGGW